MTLQKILEMRDYLANDTVGNVMRFRNIERPVRNSLNADDSHSEYLPWFLHVSHMTQNKVNLFEISENDFIVVEIVKKNLKRVVGSNIRRN